MSSQKTLEQSVSDTELLYDTNYYKFVFKKTEKVVCAVFYITDTKLHDHQRSVVDSACVAAKACLDRVISSLSFDTHRSGAICAELRDRLIALQSHVRLLHAVSAISSDAADVFDFEIENILRTLRGYLRTAPFDTISVPTERYVSRAATASSGAPSQHTPAGTTADAERAERIARIKDTLVSLGEASIKDISTHITGYSEKTIQRDLNALIKDGVVLKKGERRWSRYSIS